MKEQYYRITSSQNALSPNYSESQTVLRLMTLRELQEHKFKILATDCKLPSLAVYSNNDTLVQSDDGLIIFTRQEFLDPIYEWKDITSECKAIIRTMFPEGFYVSVEHEGLWIIEFGFSGDSKVCSSDYKVEKSGVRYSICGFRIFKRSK